MRKITLQCLLLLISATSFGQTTIWQESFETDGNGTRYNASNTFRDGTNDHFQITDGSDINVLGGDYSGQDGTFYWAMEDTDDNGGDGLSYKNVVFNQVTTTGFSDITFTGAFAKNDRNDEYDFADGAVVSYSTDGGATWVQALKFRYDNANGDSFNEDLGLISTINTSCLIDTASEGFGDCSDTETPVGGANIDASQPLSNVFSDISFTVPGTPSTVDIRIEVSFQSAGEEFAFDNFRLQGMMGPMACDITCPANITATADPMMTTATVTYADPTLSGDCSMAGFTQTAGLPSGSDFPLGTTTNTFEATDANDGTVVTCSFSVTVNESTAPTAACMDIDLELDDMGMASITPEDVSPIELINGYELDQDGTFDPIDISETGTNVTLGDDQLSGALPVGFTFSFFGNDYTDFHISSNGFITFDPATGNGCCSGRTIPSADGLDDIIALAWEDLNPSSGGTIRYETLGTAPNRTLVVEFFEVNHFFNTNPVTAQAILYEGSNRIELHTTTLNAGSGLHTQGIENADGTQAVAVDGRVAVDFSATNDFVSFTPLTITATPDIFDCSTTGDQMVTVTVTGDDGQSASCVSTVNVIPNVNFTGCPVDIFTATGDTTNCGVIVDYTTPTGTSVCGTPTITQTAGPASGSVFPVGETLVEFTADVNGSTAVCSFMVTVIDSAFPELDCPGDLIVSSDDDGNYEIEDYTAATDNCTASGDIVTTQEPAAGTIVTEGSTTTVTVTATDEAGNTTTCTFDVLVDSTLSVTEQGFSKAISIYPNPTSNVVTLNNSSAAIINKIEVVDVNGRVLSISNTTVSRETQIDFSSYATGVYFVQITAGNTTTVKRIVKQ